MLIDEPSLMTLSRHRFKAKLKVSFVLISSPQSLHLMIRPYISRDSILFLALQNYWRVALIRNESARRPPPRPI